MRFPALLLLAAAALAAEIPSPTFAFLPDGRRLPVSRAGYERLRELL